jgi:ribosomal protein S21
MENNQDRKLITLPTDTMIDPVFEAMLKSFLSKTKREGIIEEVRRRRYYIKKSEQKRLNNKIIKK